MTRREYFNVRICVDNAAFEDRGAELERILHKLAHHLGTHNTAVSHILDINGNIVGKSSFTLENVK